MRDLIIYLVAGGACLLTLVFARLIGAWDGTTADCAWYLKLATMIAGITFGGLAMWIIGLLGVA